MTCGMLIAEAMYRPPIALPLVAACVVVVLALAGIAARREQARWTALLRFAALAGLIWVLLGYSLTRPGAPGSDKPPSLAVLIDTSASMNEPDAAVTPAGPPVTRLEALRRNWLNDETLALLRRHADVELLAFDSRTRPIQPDQLKADGDATRLLEAIGRTDADTALILSDGHDTTTPGIAGPPPTAPQTPRLYAVPVGSPRSAPDLALQAWADSDRLFESQTTRLVVTLNQRGMQGRSAVVELKHNGETIDRRPVTLGRTSTQMSFQISPELKPGKQVQAHHYAASVTLNEGGEAYTENNSEDVFVQVSRGRIRVLLLEGEPYWDTRSLARLIGSHPRFDLTAVYAFGDRRRGRLLGKAATADDPIRDLQAFDVVILGRRVERLTDEGFAQRLVGFVRGGGAAVFARGRPFNDNDAAGRSLLAGIEPISPVAWAEPVVGTMRVQLGGSADPRGPLADLQDPGLLTELPGMLAATRIEGRKAASLVLLEQQPARGGTPMVAMASLRAGAGMVMAVLTEGLWRWELLPGVSNATQTRTVFGGFWVRALQWLASGGEFLPGQDIALEADHLGVQPGEPVKLTVSTRYIEAQGLRLSLTATDTDGIAQALPLTPSPTPGRYTASFTPSRPGVYQFRLTTPGRADLIPPDEPLTTRLSVVERSEEKRDTSARPELLKELVESTGGLCLDTNETGPLIDYLQSLHELRLPQQGADYAFNHWPAFVWIAGCFGLEWVLRRRNGLR